MEAPWLTFSKEGKGRLLRRKVMASLFLDAKDIVFIDNLQKGRTTEDTRYNDGVCYQIFCCKIRFAVIKKLKDSSNA